MTPAVMSPLTLQTFQPAVMLCLMFLMNDLFVSFILDVLSGFQRKLICTETLGKSNVKLMVYFVTRN